MSLTVSKKDLEGARVRAKKPQKKPDPKPVIKPDHKEITELAIKLAEVNGEQSTNRLVEVVEKGFEEVNKTLAERPPKEKRNFLFTVNRDAEGFIESVNVTET